MTSPDHNVPPDAYMASNVSSMQNVDQKTIAHRGVSDTENILGNVQSSFLGVILSGFNSIGSAIGKALSDITEALFGNYGGDNQALVTIDNGMTALNDRIDTMGVVSGFGTSFMSHNCRYQGGGNFRAVPFDRRYGPEKNCSFDSATGIWTLAKGTWTVTPIIATGGGNGGPTMFARLIVYKPDGVTVHIEQPIVFNTTWSGYVYSLPVPVIVPEPGYKVQLYFRHGEFWWYLLGGTDRTKLVLNRWDNRTDNDAVLPVPGSEVTINQ